jgi:hypothetical protein
MAKIVTLWKIPWLKLGNFEKNKLWLLIPMPTELCTNFLLINHNVLMHSVIISTNQLQWRNFDILFKDVHENPPFFLPPSPCGPRPNLLTPLKDSP